MATTYLIDTNILVYAYNEDSNFHEKALKLLENALNKNIYAVIADKNLFEFFAVITDSRRVENPITIDEAIEIINFLVDSNIKIIYSSSFVFLKTIELVRRYKIKRQEIFDINLVSLMIQNKIDTIITANDRHFKKIKEIKVFNPFKQQKENETGGVIDTDSLAHEEKLEKVEDPEKKDKPKED